MDFRPAYIYLTTCSELATVESEYATSALYESDRIFALDLISGKIMLVEVRDFPHL